MTWPKACIVFAFVGGAVALGLAGKESLAMALAGAAAGYASQGEWRKHETDRELLRRIEGK